MCASQTQHALGQTSYIIQFLSLSLCFFHYFLTICSLFFIVSVLLEFRCTFLPLPLFLLTLSNDHYTNTWHILNFYCDFRMINNEKSMFFFSSLDLSVVFSSIHSIHIYMHMMLIHNDHVRVYSFVHLC